MTVEQSHPALCAGHGAAFSVEIKNDERLVVVQEVKRSSLRKLDVDMVVGAIRESVSDAHDLSVYAIVLLRPGSIPRTSSGKIQRHACRDGFLNGGLNVVSERRLNVSSDATDNDVNLPVAVSTAQSTISAKKWLVSQLAERLGVHPSEINPNHNFSQYGLDSLDAVDLVGRLGRFLNRTLPDSLFLDHPTIESVASYLSHDLQMDGPTEVIEPSLRIDSANEETPLPLSEQRFAMMNERFRETQAQGRYFYESVIEQQDGRSATVNGRQLLMVASYSYLGLAGHPKINQAAQAAVEKFGTGLHGVRLLAGTTQPHKELERTIARFKRADDAVVFSSGYVANLAAISALLRKGDTVICDKLNHASIVDGCLLSEAELMSYRHNDITDLERCLQQSGPGGKLVVTDAVFSMDGDIANLPEIVRLCKQYGAYLMVDEAHSIGVLGDTGHGIEEHFGLDSDAVDIKMGTLSKAIPSCGGYIAGKSELICALRHNARGYIFSAALPPAQVGAAKAALDVIEAEPERVSDLHRKVGRYLSGVRALGFDTCDSETSIVPIVCKTEQLTYEMVSLCREAGLFVVPVVFPAVPKDSPRLRTTITAAHTDEDIDFILDVLKHAGKQCGLIGATGEKML